jgi:hypothetical protein
LISISKLFFAHDHKIQSYKIEGPATFSGPSHNLTSLDLSRRSGSLHAVNNAFGACLHTSAAATPP